MIDAKILADHFEEDKAQFKKLNAVLESQNKDHDAFKKSLVKIEEFMSNLDGINNVVKGTKLLKTPSLWLIALVVGVVALAGGLKTIIGWFVFSR